MIKNTLIAFAVIAFMGAGVALAAGGGFNQYGYNDGARIFNGTLAQWCEAEGIAPTNADCGPYGFGSVNDRLVMKWNAQWDACNANGYDNPAYCLGAWTDNEFNGNVPGGSGVVWHYKIIWVGSQGESSPYWLPGGYSVWGNYEVVMDQGTDRSGNASCSNTTLQTNNGGHGFCTLAAPNGYGAVFSQ